MRRSINSPDSEMCNARPFPVGTAKHLQKMYLDIATILYLNQTAKNLTTEGLLIKKSHSCDSGGDLK